MISNVYCKVLIFACANTILLSCSNHRPDKMTEAESSSIENEIRNVSDKITGYSERAELDSFLSFYDNSPEFLHFSSDGTMRNYEELKKICTEYYTTLKEQKIVTIREKIHVLDTSLVVFGWTGNIVAHFKNGDTMIMKNYSITNLFKKTGSNWKIIHSHESALPPEIIKKE